MSLCTLKMVEKHEIYCLTLNFIKLIQRILILVYLNCLNIFESETLNIQKMEFESNNELSKDIFLV